MSTTLDMITGGSVLPYVYCKKVTLERSPADPGLTDVTLQLELYQEKNTLSNSTWLNSLGVQGVNLMDALFIQTAPVLKAQHVDKLLASSTPIVESWGIVDAGSVYVAQQALPGLDVLPRSSFSGEFLPEKRGNYLFNGGVDPGIAIQFSAFSMLGSLTKGEFGFLTSGVIEGQAREEIKNGKPYYVIPFEYKYTEFNEKGEDNNLGFLFYTFLNIPYYLAQLSLGGLDIPYDAYSSMLEEYVVEGPINTVVVFKNGQVQEDREVFVQQDGRVWEGSVHLHMNNNPAPDGYSGDGSFGDNKGWMVGASHKPGVDQPRLSLIKAPNNLISDFRSGVFAEPADTALGLGSETKVFNLGEDVTKAEAFLSPFQKEKRKDFIKDNDSEFSKLYVCRDRDNNARGMFFIDMFELLRNNSSLYPLLFDKYAQGLSGVIQASAVNPGDKMSILQKSRILELKLYRDRVKKRVVNTRYEKYANDKFYEEPSQLIGTLGDLDGYQTPSQNSNLVELTGVKTSFAIDPLELSAPRYFMFHDSEVGEQVAGLYRYRLELEFKDGTYEFLYELYQDLVRTKIRLDSYHELANSSFSTGDITKTIYKTENYAGTSYTKRVTKNYFQNGSFVDEFAAEAVALFEDKPWTRAPTLLSKVQRVFGIYPKVDGKKINFVHPSIKNMLLPYKHGPGSPQGINFFSRMMQTAIDKIQSLLDATKVNNTGSEIDSSSVPNGYTFNNFFDIVVSPSDSIIREQYTFDHPSELFRGISNEDIYVDYLSIGQAKDGNFEGLRSMSPEYYSDRCRLDAVKFSSKAIGVGWEEYNIGFGTTGFALLPSDTFASTGYSYLTPSIVELSDPTENNNSYNFYYSAFNDGARYHLADTDAPLYSNHFTILPNYDKLFISLLNYNLNKENNDDVDMTSAAHFRASEEPGTFNIAKAFAANREPYKRLFENISMTVHDDQYYDSFFAHEPGPSPPAPDGLGTLNDFEYDKGLDVEDYSDGAILSQNYFKKILGSGKQGLIKSPAVNPGPYAYNIGLPNPFKLREIRQKRLLAGDEEIFQPAFVQAYNSSHITPDVASTGNYEAFFFFNISLTATIEVFRGTGVFAKDDENRWSPLTKSDLGLTGNEKIFCRIVLYDPSLSKGVRLTTLDKYFLIYKDGANPLIPPVSSAQPFPGGEVGTTLSFWESQNQDTLNNFMNMIEKGLMTEGKPRIMPPYEDIYGGDPDPSAGAEGMPGTSGASTDDVPTGPGQDYSPTAPPAGGGTDPFAQTPGAASGANTFQGGPGQGPGNNGYN